MGTLGKPDRPMADTFEPDQNGNYGDIRGEKKARRTAIADERAVRAVHLRITKAWSYAQIGNELGITAPAAIAAYRRGVAMLTPKEEIEEAKQIALQKLDVWEQEVLAILHSTHVMVNFGRVVEGIEDMGPKLQAIDRLVKIERERRAIIGYNAPNKRVLEVVTEDVFERAIRELNADAARLEREAAHAVHEEGLAALRGELAAEEAPEAE